MSTDFVMQHVEAAGYPFLVLDGEGRVHALNCPAERLIGLSFDEIQGKRIWDLFGVSPDSEKAREALEEIRTRGAAREHGSAWFYEGEGGRCICWLCVPCQIEKGRNGYILAAGIDLTEPLASRERRLQEELARMRIMLDAAVDSMALVDTGMKIRWANKAAAAILKRTPEEMTGHTCHELYQNRSTPCPDCPSLRAIVSGETEHGLIYQPAMNVVGETYWDNYGVPVRNDKGEIIGAVEVVRDVTREVRIQKALEDAQGRLSAIIQAIRNPLFLVDQERTIVWCNDTCLEQFGTNIIGRKCYSVLCKQNRKCEGCFIVEDAQSGKNVRHEKEAVSVAGSRFFECSASAVSASGNNNGKEVVILAYDLTDHKKAKAGFQKYQSALRLLSSQLVMAEERERRRLALDLHDSIAQNIAIAQLRLKTLQGGVSDPGVLKEVLDIAKSLEMTGTMIETLIFELSPPVLYQLGLVPALHSLAAQMERSHHLSIYVRDDQHPKPLGEEVQVLLFRAVRELLINVVKHAHARTVKVVSRREGGMMRIQVIDDGIGFDVEGADKAYGQHGGFGLFSLKERLECLGGSFEISSSAGRGTSISLLVPLEEIGTEEDKAT